MPLLERWSAMLCPFLSAASKGRGCGGKKCMAMRRLTSLIASICTGMEAGCATRYRRVRLQEEAPGAIPEAS